MNKDQELIAYQHKLIRINELVSYVKNDILDNGSAKILQSFQQLEKTCNEPVGNEKEASVVWVLMGLIIFGGPWVYGIYKMFAG